jgi:Carboxypeptidase regulatory-like domain
LQEFIHKRQRMRSTGWLLLFAAALLGCNSSQPAPQPPSPSAAESAPVTIDAATAGGVNGVVSFKGSAPKLPLLDMTQDPGCPTQPQLSDAIAVKNGKLANVFVYVKDGLPPGKFAVPSEPVVLDQKGCRYIPHVLGVMAGQPLKILNSDTADHNIHDLPRNNQEWNQSQMPTDPPIMKAFVHPEMMIPLQCNQHPWMRAYVSVLPHPYFAVSAADGSFQIKNLPPGEYTLVAVHEKFGEQNIKIKVEPKTSAKADFSFGEAK